MEARIPQSQAKLVVFKAFLAADHVTAATSKTIAMQVSQNGGAFANFDGGAINATEISAGWYKIQLQTADTDTKGPLIVRGTEGTIDPVEIVYHVVNATNADFTALPAAVADAGGGLPISDAGGLDMDNDAANALVAINLDHWMKTAVNDPTNLGGDGGDEVADNTVAALMLSTDGDADNFNYVTESLQSIRDAITAGGPLTYALDISSTINTGSAGSGSTWTDAASPGGNDWEIEDAAGDGGAIHSATSDFTIDMICEFNMGAGRIAGELDIRGYFNRSGGGGYIVEVYAYNYTTAAWVKLSQGTATTELRDRANNMDYVFDLDSAYTDLVTTAGEVKIGLVSTRQTDLGGDVLYLDYVRVSGEPSGGVTPAAIAVAVHTELDEHLEHLPMFTGNIWYADKNGGDDGNSGHTPNEAFETIGAAISAASAGEYIKVKAGTYVETGIDMNLAGLELHGEIGAVIDPASGSALTISAAHCYVETIEVRPAAGEVGFDIASGSDHSHLHDCHQSTTGGTGIKIDSAASYIVITQTECSGYTSIGVELNGAQCILDGIVCRGQGGSETGFKLNHTNAHRNILTSCASIDNATRSFDVVSGADDNLFQMCADSDGCGARADAGANNAWRDFMEADVQEVDVTYVMGTILTEGAAGRLAGGIIKFFNVASPTGTCLSLPDAVPGAAGGVFIAGSNAATTLATLTVSGTTTLTGAVATGAVTFASLAITGNLSVGGTTTLTGVVTIPDSRATLQTTTIASLASQTSFTLTVGSSDNDAYNTMMIVVEDGTTGAQKAVGYIADYVGNTKTVTLVSDPGIFTMAIGDKVTILALPEVTGSTGLNVVTITVNDDAGTPAAISGVECWISTDSAGANIIKSGITDSSGVMTNKPHLTDGTYYVRLSINGYNMTNLPETLTVSGATSDTYTMTTATGGGGTQSGYLEYDSSDVMEFVKTFIGGTVTDATAMAHVVAGALNVYKAIDPRTKPPRRHHWSFLQPKDTIVFWATATGTMSVSTTTITDSTNSPFYETMVGHTLVADTSETEYTISGYTSSSVITVSADASADDGDTFTITADGRYYLPTRYAGVKEAPVYVYSSSGHRRDLNEVTPETIYELWRGTTTAGYTENWATEAQTHDTSASQQYAMIVAPIPTEDMEAIWRMVCYQPDPAVDTYFLGGRTISMAIRNAALADAELVTGHVEGTWAREARKALIAAIDEDNDIISSDEPEQMETA